MPHDTRKQPPSKLPYDFTTPAIPFRLPPHHQRPPPSTLGEFRFSLYPQLSSLYTLNPFARLKIKTRQGEREIITGWDPIAKGGEIRGARSHRWGEGDTGGFYLDNQVSLLIPFLRIGRQAGGGKKKKGEDEDREDTLDSLPQPSMPFFSLTFFLRFSQSFTIFFSFFFHHFQIISFFLSNPISQPNFFSSKDHFCPFSKPYIFYYSPSNVLVNYFFFFYRNLRFLIFFNHSHIVKIFFFSLSFTRSGDNFSSTLELTATHPVFLPSPLSTSRFSRLFWCHNFIQFFRSFIEIFLIKIKATIFYLFISKLIRFFILFQIHGYN